MLADARWSQAAHVFLDVAETCKVYEPTNIVSIGDATGELLRKAGAEIVYSPSKALAKVLAQELPPVPGRTTRILYPASKRAARTLEDGLGGRGFEVKRLNTYDTVPADWTEEETVGLPLATSAFLFRLGILHE
jgi:uroporphyrinogen-III synthase